jgi:hypothetical protein
LHNGRSGETEIDYLHKDLTVALSNEHEIGWFDVAVH